LLKLNSIKNKKINPISPIQKIGEHSGFLHISDTTGLWVPNGSVFKEGVIPGDRRIREESLAKFFNYITQEHPNIRMSVEIYNKDFRDPTESTEAVRRVIGWLDKA